MSITSLNACTRAQDADAEDKGHVLPKQMAQHSILVTARADGVLPAKARLTGTVL